MFSTASNVISPFNVVFRSHEIINDYQIPMNLDYQWKSVFICVKVTANEYDFDMISKHFEGLQHVVKISWKSTAT